MATQERALRLAIALSLFAPIPYAAFAQSQSIEVQAEPREDWYEAAPGLGSLVLNAPFSAEAITTWRPSGNSEPSEWRATTRYFRDREGRVRVEQIFVDRAGDRGPQRVILAPVPGSHPVYVIDSLARTASELPRLLAAHIAGGLNRVVLPVSMTSVITFHRPQYWHALVHDGAFDEESLGSRTMVGIQATGTRTRFSTTLPHRAFGGPIQIADERWVSPGLHLLVYSRTEDSKIGVVEHRVTSISQADPPGELFEIPADYSVTAPNYPLTFHNPYRPETRQADVRLGRR